MPPQGIAKIGIKVRIPRELHDKVTLLLLDPKRMQVGYGNWTNLMTHLLEQWVSDQIAPSSTEQVNDSHD